MIAVKTNLPFRGWSFHRHVSDDLRVFWQAPVDSVKDIVQVCVDHNASNDGRGDLVSLGIRSDEIKGVSHDPY